MRIKPKVAIVTGADHLFFEHKIIQGLVRSIFDKKESSTIDFCMIDCGMNFSDLKWLQRYIKKIKPVQQHFKKRAYNSDRKITDGQLSRVFLPDYFPGYDIYIWLDADTWVQDWTAVQYLIDVTKFADFAICPEIHRKYHGFYDLKLKVMIKQWYEDAYGNDVAQRFCLNPVMNSGVFVATSRSPVWQLWRKELAKTIQKTDGFFVEQTTLNYLIYTKKLLPHYLPAYCNFCAGQARPFYNLSTKKFTEPCYPFPEVGILHITGFLPEDKLKTRDLECLTSRGITTIQKSLGYPGLFFRKKKR